MNIDPSCPFDCVFSNAASTAPRPKHLTAWLLRLDVAANTFLTLSLAFPGSALKEMVFATFIISDRNLWLKKTVDSRTPVDLETLYNHMRSEAKNIPNMSLYTPSSCSSVLRSGSSSAISSWLDKDGHLSLLLSSSRKQNHKLVNLMIEATHRKC